MSKLELFFTGLFIVGTVVVMILIYFYNVRHKLVIENEIDDYEVEKKPGEKVVASSDENFNWDMYESDLKYDYDSFVGYDIWKSKKSADARIKKLQDDFSSGTNVIKINMIESMLLVDRFSDDISLDENGIYRIGAPLLSEFLKDLKYDVEMVEKIEEIKEEIDFSIETYEIDARKIFYIMRNAKSLGAANFINHQQIFLFAKNNKNIVIDMDASGGRKEDLGELDLYIENFDDMSFCDNVDNNSTQNKEQEKENILSGIRNISNQAKIYFDDDGKRIIEYPSGEKIIKSGLWDINVVEEEENRIDKAYKNSRVSSEERREKFSDIINEDSVDAIMSDENNEAVEPKKDDIKKKEVSQDEKIKILNEKISNAMFYAEDKKRVPTVGYFGEVNSLENYFEKIKSLSDTNKKILTILLLSIDAAKISVDEKDVNLIIEVDGRSYISYDWIAFLFISLIENRSEFLKSNNIVSKKSFTLNFISEFAEKIVSILNDDGIEIVKNNSKRVHTYFMDAEDKYVSMSVFELSAHAEHLLSTYNSEDKLRLIRSTKIDKSDFKESGEEKYNITFRSMFE
jgi:hypothetical protein